MSFPKCKQLNIFFHGITNCTCMTPILCVIVISANIGSCDLSVCCASEPSRNGLPLFWRPPQTPKQESMFYPSVVKLMRQRYVPDPLLSQHGVNCIEKGGVLNVSYRLSAKTQTNSMIFGCDFWTSSLGLPTII